MVRSKTCRTRLELLPVEGSTEDPDHDGSVRDGRILGGNPEGQVEAILAHFRHRVPLRGAPENQTKQWQNIYRN